MFLYASSYTTIIAVSICSKVLFIFFHCRFFLIASSGFLVGFKVCSSFAKGCKERVKYDVMYISRNLLICWFLFIRFKCFFIPWNNGGLAPWIDVSADLVYCWYNLVRDVGHHLFQFNWSKGLRNAGSGHSRTRLWATTYGERLWASFIASVVRTRSGVCFFSLSITFLFLGVCNSKRYSCKHLRAFSRTAWNILLIERHGISFSPRSYRRTSYMR